MTSFYGEFNEGETLKEAVTFPHIIYEYDSVVLR